MKLKSNEGEHTRGGAGGGTMTGGYRSGEGERACIKGLRGGPACSVICVGAVVA